MWVCQRMVNGEGHSGEVGEFFSGVAMGGVVLWTKMLNRAVIFDDESAAETVVQYYAKRFPKEFNDVRIIAKGAV